MPVTDDVFGRSSLAAANLLSGDLSAAARAAYAPLSLSTTEARTMVERMGLQDSPWGVVFSTITNPIVLLGLALNYRFPVTRAADIRKVSKQVERAAKSSLLPPWAREVLPPTMIFDDMPEVGDALMDIGREKHAFTVRQQERIVSALTSYARKAGRELSESDAFLVTAHLDGLVEEQPKALKNWRFGGKPLRTPLDLNRVKGAMTPALTGLVGDLRGVMDDVYDDVVVKNPELRAELETALQKKGIKLGKKGLEGVAIPGDVRESLKQSKRFKEVHAKMRRLGMLEVGAKVDDYWPHIVGRGMEDHQKFVDALLDASKSREEVFGKLASGGIDSRVADNLLERMGRMLPDPAELQRFPQFLHPEKWDEYQQVVAGAHREAGAGVGVVPYSLNLVDTLNTYMHRMSSTYAFNVTGAGRKLAETVGTLRAAGDYRAGLLQNTVIPLATGRPTMAEATAMQWSAGLRDRMVKSIEGPIGKILPTDVKDYMLGHLKKEAGPLSVGAAESGLTGLMYTAALGLPNVGASALNLTQSVMTTYPYIGGDAFRGLASVIRKIPKYVSERVAGVDHAAAVTKLWPEFVEEGFGQASKITSSLHQTLEEAYGRARSKGTIGQKVKDAMMSVFQRTEEFNQLVAWEGGFIKASREGMDRAQSMNFARHVVATTQYPSEVANAPLWISRIKQYPGGRLASMFSQFSMRSLGFLAGTGTTAGSGVAADPVTGRNWGTLGRALLASGLMYEAGKALGVDTSRATALGALPGPRGEGEPLYPWPFVSPAVGAVAGGAMDVLEGSTERTRRFLPMLVPGGVGLARAAGYVSPKTAQFFGRRFVDYQTFTPDGRYAVYQQREGDPTLIGYMTPQQLVMQGLGLPGVGDIRRERESVAWLVSNRKRMLAYKDQFLTAMVANDATGMAKADEAFSKAYPIPGGLRKIISPHEVKQVEMRRKVTRLERVLETLPSEVRPMFGAAIQETMMEEGGNFLGVPGGLTGGNTIRQRRSFAAGGGTYGPLPNVGG